MALAAMNVYTMLGGDLRTMFHCGSGEKILSLSPLCVIEDNKRDRVRELGTPSSVDLFL